MKKYLAFIWTIALIYTTYTLANYLIESNSNKVIYEEIRNEYNIEDIHESNEDIFDEELADAYSSPLLLINEDIVGWIKIPNTAIDYPVVRAQDNEFYLNHNIHKKPAKSGSIFMDFRNGSLAKEKNTILYGHNMKDGSMFRDLLKYREESFFYSNPIIEFNTLYEDLKWEIFSVYVTSVDFYYIETEFQSLDEYRIFLDSIKDKSLFEIDVKISEKDQILTLSTCSYEFDDARFVIHAKRVFK